MENTRISELESLQPTALDAGLVFSGKESGRLIQGYDKPSAYTPVITGALLTSFTLEFSRLRQRAPSLPTPLNFF